MKRKNKIRTQMFFLLAILLQTILGFFAGAAFCGIFFTNEWWMFLGCFIIFLMMFVFVKIADRIGIHNSLISIIIGTFVGTVILFSI